MELDSGSVFTNGSGFVVDYESILDFVSAIGEDSRPSIFLLAMGSFRQYDQSLCNMYMSTTNVDCPSGSVQIPHNYNTGLIRDLILLLFLEILREILPVADTMTRPSIVARDLDTSKHTL